MAAEGRRKANSLSQPLLEESLRTDPCTFDFFQAVRLLTLLQTPREAIGEFSPPHSEAVRIGVYPTLSFPASQIQSLSWNGDAQPILLINFLGLVGSLGLLPSPYTELVIERSRSHDTALRDFLDIFHHRAASFFYKAWEKSHFTVGFERQNEEPLTDAVYALLGLGTAGLRNRQVVIDEAFIFYAGLFGMATRPAVALEAILTHYFDVPVSIDQFIGVWRRLDESDCSFLDSGQVENYQLGVGTVVGNEVWDPQSRARIKVGPVPLARYEHFLPDGSAFEPLRTLAKAFCGNEIEFEVQLILERKDVPTCELSDPELDGPRLGWLTWLKSKPAFDRDPGDTVFLI